MRSCWHHSSSRPCWGVLVRMDTPLCSCWRILRSNRRAFLRMLMVFSMPEKWPTFTPLTRNKKLLKYVKQYVYIHTCADSVLWSFMQHSLCTLSLFHIHTHTRTHTWTHSHTQAMRPLAQAENKDAEHTPLSLFNYFVGRCRENLHVILAFSPIGDAFRNRMRKFPSLINCCTIDWFQAWPDDALGKHILNVMSCLMSIVFLYPLVV